MRSSLLLALCLACIVTVATTSAWVLGRERPTRKPAVTFEGSPELVHPGLVSTDRSEVKITFSPDGRRMLWGAIGWEGGRGGWDVWESVKSADGSWGKPAPAGFDSEANDFDPCFAPDGSGVYFFSNRPGGLGGDDIWFAPWDAKSAAYGEAVNLGPNVNSKGDEWGPVVSADGKRLLFCTDGRGGAGKHDIFVSRRTAKGWAAPERLAGPINSEADDFDPVFLGDGQTIVFASGDLENGPVKLYATVLDRGVTSARTELPERFNSPTFLNFGCSVVPAEPGVLYVTSSYEGNASGRADIYRIRYTLK